MATVPNKLLPSTAPFCTTKQRNRFNNPFVSESVLGSNTFPMMKASLPKIQNFLIVETSTYSVQIF